MPQKGNASKLGPRSGRFTAISTASQIVIVAQTSDQTYRFYNTGNDPITVKIGATPWIVEKGCSIDLNVPASMSSPATTVTIAGSATSEAVFESFPATDIRSGRFKLAPTATNRAVVRSLGFNAVYRFFNTRKSGAFNVIVTSPSGAAVAHPLAEGCSKDVSVGATDFVSIVNTEGAGKGPDGGVYDFLTLATANAKVDGAVRTGHFNTPTQIVSLATGALGTDKGVVYRIINSGQKEIALTGGVTGTILPDSSCDVQLPFSSSLSVGLVAGASGQIRGSYEILKVN
jgi:hypothetical protein